MLKFLASLIVSLAGIGLLVIGVIGPLTVPGVPKLADIGLYAVLPVAMIAVSISYTSSTILKFLLTIVLIAAIAVLGYVALAFFA
ncbi:hypothetical protein [Parvularcula lutaonensis]|uniref:DUF131 domain-containing protein n=1 Tax=Parvularcula lutaonensis TaxID=491923 RepID=A0ABV7MAY7_9PROT|nr:hypothetical protein [Parvularcula lutaonensis]GGY43158.1 hypothetical protein GCM10007148_09840 [Parvularcula lutaonensis]